MSRRSSSRGNSDTATTTYRHTGTNIPMIKYPENHTKEAKSSWLSQCLSLISATTASKKSSLPWKKNQMSKPTIITTAAVTDTSGNKDVDDNLFRTDSNASITTATTTGTTTATVTAASKRAKKIQQSLNLKMKFLSTKEHTNNTSMNDVEKSSTRRGSEQTVASYTSNAAHSITTCHTCCCGCTCCYPTCGCCPPTSSSAASSFTAQSYANKLSMTTNMRNRFLLSPKTLFLKRRQHHHHSSSQQKQQPLLAQSQSANSHELLFSSTAGTNSKRHSVCSYVSNQTCQTPPMSGSSRPSSVMMMMMSSPPQQQQQPLAPLDYSPHFTPMKEDSIHGLVALQHPPMLLYPHQKRSTSSSSSCFDVPEQLPSPLEERWIMKHELIQLAMDGLFSVPEKVTLSHKEENHILQIGDIQWGIDIASQYPKWTVIGIGYVDDHQHSSTTTTSLCYTHSNIYQQHHYSASPTTTTTTATHTTNNTPNMTINTKNVSTSNLLASSPRNFKFISMPRYNSSNNKRSIIQLLKDDFPQNELFDFIELRSCFLLEYTFEKYQQLIQECQRLCRKNGYIEVLELDMRIYHHRASILPAMTHALNNDVMQMLENKGLNPRLARQLQDICKRDEKEEEPPPLPPSSTTAAATSVVVVHKNYISLPLGTWGGRLGLLFRDDMYKLLELCHRQQQQQQQQQAEKAGGDEMEEKEESLLWEKKLETLDQELLLNKAFMNLHFILFQKKQ